MSPKRFLWVCFLSVGMVSLFAPGRGMGLYQITLLLKLQIISFRIVAGLTPKPLLATTSELTGTPLEIYSPMMMLSILFLLSLPSLLFIPGSQVQAKTTIAGSPQVREKARKIVGPFWSREDLDEYTKVVLKNGLTAIIFERRDIPLAAITAYVKAGYSHESETQKGVTDVVRHSVLFGRKPPGDAHTIQQMSDFGGLFEAETFADYTQYSALVPSSSFQKGMKLTALAIQNRDFIAPRRSRVVSVLRAFR